MMPDNQASSKPASAYGGGEPFSSPLFCEVAAQFDSSSRHVILELGAISSGILSLLQGKRCRILVANAAQALSVLSEKTQDFELLLREVQKLIGDTGIEKVDTVLCWDLLNYLSLPLLKAFATHLAVIMAPTAVLHAYIHSADANMAQHPQRYSVTGEDKVVRLDHDPAVRKTPRYSYSDLEKHTVGLHVERSMLLRNGMQEYLLRMNQV
ncbi:MAG: hypothetical protein PVI97_16115 [Candidatus Thiodiazotropha sp.]|jgi:hypothetical protein